MAVANLGEAMRAARTAAGLTQTEVADRLVDEHKMTSTQPQISDWERGELKPDFDQLAAFEDVVGVPRGYVLTTTGHVEGKASVEAAIAADSTLDEQARFTLLNAYKAALRALRSPTRAGSRRR